MNIPMMSWAASLEIENMEGGTTNINGALTLVKG